MSLCSLDFDADAGTQPVSLPRCATRRFLGPVWWGDLGGQSAQHRTTNSAMRRPPCEELRRCCKIFGARGVASCCETLSEGVSGSSGIGPPDDCSERPPAPSPTKPRRCGKHGVASGAATPSPVSARLAPAVSRLPQSIHKTMLKPRHDRRIDSRRARSGLPLGRGVTSIRPRLGSTLSATENVRVQWWPATADWPVLAPPTNSWPLATAPRRTSSRRGIRRLSARAQQAPATTRDFSLRPCDCAATQRAARAFSAVARFLPGALLGIDRIAAGKRVLETSRRGSQRAAHPSMPRGVQGTPALSRSAKQSGRACSKPVPCVLRNSPDYES